MRVKQLYFLDRVFLPCKSKPPNSGGEDLPPKLAGAVSGAPCFIVFFECRPVNQRGGYSSVNLGSMGPIG